MIAIRKLYRWIIYAIIALFALLFISVAIIRFVIFPNIDNYKQDIASKITEKIGLKVDIGQIVPSWDGLSPKILIHDIDIFDDQNASALHLKEVSGTLSWLSIPMLETHLSELSLQDTALTIQRRPDGAIYAAGIALTGKGDPKLGNWILKQGNVSVNNATILWQDQLRQAPSLSLNKVSLKLSNPPLRKLIGQHLFEVSAIPSVGTSKPIYLNGDFFGSDLNQTNRWYGNTYLQINNTDLTTWKQWIDYPLQLESGNGDTKIWLSFAKNKITEIKAKLALENLSIRKNSQEKFVAKLFSGEIQYTEQNDIQKLNANNIKLATKDQVDIDGAQVNFSRSIKNKKPWSRASFNVAAFNLAALKKLETLDMVPAAFLKYSKALKPEGTLKDIRLSWKDEEHKPQHYSIKADFKDLGVLAYQNIPGFTNLTGKIDANQNFGTLTLASREATLNFKEILRWPIPNNTIDGTITWRHYDAGKFKLHTRKLAISNPHVGGTVSVDYDMNGIKQGYLDLTGDFGNGIAQHAPFYYPTILGDNTLQWLDSSIKSGKAEDIHLTIKGSLADFPYVTKSNQLDPKLGSFSVSAKISDAVLEYGSNWPAITNLGLDLLFEGKRMELNANTGNILGNQITQCKTTIEKLDADSPMLTIVGNTKGKVEDAIKFVNQSPVKEVALGFTDNLKTAGEGRLNLKIAIPLKDLDNSKYSGVYTASNGKLLTDPSLGIPEISNINGVLSFSETGLNAKEMHGDILGGPAIFNLRTASGSIIHIDAKGSANAEGLNTFVSNPITAKLTGNTNWSGRFTVDKPLVNFNIESNLEGLTIDLPAPFQKAGAQVAQLKIEKNQSTKNQDRLTIAYNDLVFADILRKDKNGNFEISRGDIGLNMAAKVTDKTGLTAHGQLDYVNVDEWMALFDKSNSKSQGINISTAYLTVGQLDIFNRSIKDLELTTSPISTGYKIQLKSPNIKGRVEWKDSKEASQTGKIIARLERLILPKSNKEDQEKDEPIRRLDSHYPDLDIIANRFEIGNKKLGKLTLNAFENDNQSWVIKELLISNPDNTLTTDGVWHNWTRSPSTFLNFTLQSSNIKNTLTRFGQADVVKGGKADITGQLQWPGSPHDFKTKGLNGNFKLNAQKGEIVKVKPGVGRLLGLLSLQSLPRRLTLDFRDLFSEGFAFDKINATAEINNGVMASDDFFMTGPAAEVEIKGETDLQKETQNLRIKVVPHVSDGISLAALAGGPVAGVAAFVAQKILKDPLNKIAQSEYLIKGTWDNPVEEKSAIDDTTNKQQSPL